MSQIWASEHLLGRIVHKTSHTATSDDDDTFLAAGDQTTVEEPTDEEVRLAAEAAAAERRLARYGEPLLDPETGVPLQAFEPILDLETALAIRGRFADHRGRGQQRKRRAARLLSGLDCLEARTLTFV